MIKSPTSPYSSCEESSALDFDFDFAYQPIVDVRDRSIFCQEALIRGVNGEGALSVLSKVDESSRYKFDEKCRVRAISSAAELNISEYLSINILPSAVFERELFLSSILEAVKTYNFPIDRLIFETVESENIHDKKEFATILGEYKKIGLKTAIDDFGAGYSGLSLLADFQPDLIKLDMSLVRDISRSNARQAIVRGVLRMCDELKITVIAEGVESFEEQRVLFDCGIFLMQGYLFARPAFKSLGVVELGSFMST